MVLTIAVFLQRWGKDRVDATIAVYAAKTRQGTKGWRAYLGGQKRFFGTTKETKTQTVTALMDRHSKMFSVDERERVRRFILAHEGRVCGDRGSQPTSTTPAASDAHRNVEYVHQIYGCFRDGKPMPDLFRKSQPRWKNVAREMGATYVMWSADMVDTLIRDYYPQFLDM